MKPKKVLFIIPDGVGIRNYLYSDIITNLKDKAEIVFWSSLQKEAFQETFALHNIKVEYKKIELPVENLKTRLYRESATFARLVYNAEKQKNHTILSNWNKNGKGFKLRLLYTFSEKIGNWASRKYNRILNLEEKSRSFWSRKVVDDIKNELQKLKPDSIFITHQRVASLMPICIAAKELGIKINTAIYSWDNLPKARMAVLADNYFVWSKYMKNEMQEYYPEVNEKNVIVTGTPQFEFYLDNNRISDRKNFAKKYNLDENKKWICFSGDDKITSPYDAVYLRDVAESVSQIEKNKRPQIIFRRSPADNSDRYDAVLNEFSELIISINPLWHMQGNNWGAFFPVLEDVNLLVNLAYHCEVAINVGSTMAHDFSTFDKPCIYINYDQKESPNWSVDTIYKFQHFRSMDGIDAVGWLNSKQDIKEKISTVLENTGEIGPERKKWLYIIVNQPLVQASVSIANELLA